MTERVAPPPDAEGIARTAHFKPQDQEDTRKKPVLIEPTPFVWVDPAQIPRRRWLYNFHMIRSFTSATFAPGETGKSRLLVSEALALVTGRNLLGVEPAERTNVWLWNGEDPKEELERCVEAAMLYHSVNPSEITGRFFLDSGRDQEIVIALMNRGGTTIARPLGRASDLNNY